MKTAKKLFSLLLVAVLMLSAIPFQASADEIVSKAIFYSKDSAEKLCEVILTDGKVTSVPAAPAVEGYTFRGWKIGSAGSTVVTDLASQNLNPYLTDKLDADGETVLFKYVYITATYNQDHVHTMSEPVTVPADCENDGSITKTCTDPNCPVLNYKEVETITKLGHDFGAWFEETAAQVGVAGVEKRECQREGCDYFETRNTDPLPAPPAPTYLVEFYDIDGNKIAERNWEMYKTITNADLPLAPEVLNKDFMGWFTSPTSNIELEAGDRFDNYYNKFYARYEDSTHDGQSRINVYFRLYSEGVAQGQARKLTSFQATDYTNLEDALDARMGQFSDMLEGVVDMNMYQVADGYYVYNPSTGEQTSLSSSAKVNGDTSIIIRLDANRSARATVMVFVHKKVDAAAAYTYTMSGYTVNDTVFESDVETLLKSKGSNYTINGMYSDLMWERKNDGYTTNPVDTLSIEDDGENGVLKIHVLAEKFAPTGTTTSKPASNPTTGDAIMATAGIMALSGAAFVTLTQLRKRKMI